MLTSHKTKIAYELMVCYNMTQGHFGKLKVTGKKSEKNLTCYTFLCRNISQNTTAYELSVCHYLDRGSRVQAQGHCQLSISSEMLSACC